MKKTNAYISILSLAALAACAPQDMSFTTSTLASSSPGQSDGIIPSRGLSQELELRENSKIDILFVVDNSGSMAEEQANMSSKISGFMNLVDGLDWRVALTTTDPRVTTVATGHPSAAWGDGQFRPMLGKRFMSKADGTKDQAQAALAEAIMLGDQGNGDERPINNIYRSIERDIALPAADRFFRTDSNLVVIVISDEDECSNGNCPSSNANVSKSQPNNLVNYAQATFGSGKVVMIDTIVKSPGDNSCTTSNQPAPILVSLAKMTGGIIGSVCAQDYTSILSNAGNAALSLTRSFSLSCNPIDSDKDGKVDLVLKDSAGNVLTSGYSVSGKIVTFNSSVAVGKYKADFRCAM